MQETIHLSDLWEHTITKIFKHDPESELDIMIRQWVIYNKLEDFNSLLKYTDEDLIPHGHGNISYYKENGDSVIKTDVTYTHATTYKPQVVYSTSHSSKWIYMMMMNPIIL